MNPEQFPSQSLRGGVAKSEQEPKELEVDVITRAVELEVFASGIPIEEYGDPYASVKSLIEALNESGRSRDIVKIFKEYAPLSSDDVFGVSVDMFGDTEQLYRFSLDKLLKNGHITEAEEVFEYMTKHGLPARNKVSDSLGEKHTEKDDTVYLNGLRLDLLLAKLRYQSSQSLKVSEDEVGLAEDLIAGIPESVGASKAKRYLELAEAKFGAGFKLGIELVEAERLIGALPEKDVDKFYYFANLAKTSVVVNGDSDRYIRLLLQCGYRALHSNDATGEMFKNTIEAMNAMRGKKVDPDLQMMSPQLASSVSDPLNEVIREVAKKGSVEQAFQLAELELHEDWTRWEAYAALIEGLPAGTIFPDAVKPRLKELCQSVSSPLQREKFSQFMVSLVNHGQSTFALELIDLIDLDPKHKRELYTDVAEEIRKNGGNLESVLMKLPEPHTVDELVQLGQLDKAETVFEGLSLRDKVRSGTMLIDAFIESGRDIKKLTNMVYRAMQDDTPAADFDSEYDWLHAWAPRSLFTTLLKVKSV